MRPNLKDLRFIFQGLWLSIVIAPMLSACGASAPAPTDKKDLFLSQPFRVDSVGEHVRFEFEATPDNVNLDHSYIVGLTLSRKGRTDPVTALNHGKPRLRYKLKVEICKWMKNRCEKITTEDDFQSLLRTEPSREKSLEWRKGNDDIKYIRSVAYTSDSSNWVVCRFQPTSYGRYRIDVSSSQGNPALDDPTAQISVQKKWTSSK
ncbi:hypothetical protein [Xanthomonas campestris]|uniref:hypothetical protein n=1 Tax=Xanthomonas campestris TaxID=339 RepID=UPI001E3B5EA8|nr:hypothetical protein [Xanthomonas campestris]MCC5071946.1 hypothetical protein [Xanthomonas campestris pv. plantaginis]